MQQQFVLVKIWWRNDGMEMKERPIILKDDSNSQSAAAIFVVIFIKPRPQTLYRVFILIDLNSD